MDYLTRLAEITQRIDAAKALTLERDKLIREARNAKVTWIQIQEATGLSVRAVHLALKRTEK